MVNDITIDEDGCMVLEENNPYIWLGSLYQGVDIAKESSGIPVSQPFSIDSLKSLLLHLKDIMDHNFFLSLLLISASIMTLHYETTLSKFLSCLVPTAFGSYQ